jgi:uncharacterized peroxidase-related enzyme
LRAIVDDFRLAPVSDFERILLAYVERLTVQPWSAAETHIQMLRLAGWSDRAIHDAVQVTAYFNYVNRLADGLGVSLELEESPNWPDD